MGSLRDAARLNRRMQRWLDTKRSPRAQKVLADTRSEALIDSGIGVGASGVGATVVPWSGP